jgi:hypothetical protein
MSRRNLASPYGLYVGTRHMRHKEVLLLSFLTV